MADPVELQIAEAFRTRLAQITVANGFHTDAGKHVRLGRAVDGESGDPMPALVVWIAQPVTVDAARTSPGCLPRTMLVTVEGVLEPDDDDPLADMIKLGRDIKRAVYRLDDLRLVDDNIADLRITEDEYFPREEGQRSAAVQVTFSVPYFERFERYVPPAPPDPEP